ncbi:MAG: 16S rRNA (cytidine(1402)-2'-O)-methyltransferase [Gammaproteobacteria bacterium RIFCSPHIGHO2_12_FULL_37_14]|nr:MAG: 16S rRNA (cytidine(1402)-2'-O)-methyltransferase [Gammaproteobacteria bacterium RIFCSPHIGHO2_12_FULL_37_14]
MLSDKLGTLYVVATPIGNLQDITLRALEILKLVDSIAAEDTRHTRKLLKHFSIDKPVVALHDFNERKQLQILIAQLQQGKSIALVSDAGTPLISDPGFPFVREARTCGIKIIPIPGACAAITALSVAGLPTDKFVFEGFLPAKQEARQRHLLTLVNEVRTIVFYEAPHRLLSTLQSMMEVFGGDRMSSVARELTKIYESIITNNLQSLFTYYTSHQVEQRGEIVILVAGVDPEVNTQNIVSSTHVLEILLSELPLKQAVKLASEITGQRKNVLYEMALAKRL